MSQIVRYLLILGLNCAAMSLRSFTYMSAGLALFLVGCIQYAEPSRKLTVPTVQEAYRTSVRNYDCRLASNGKNTVASHYGIGDNFAGKRTASGERLNPKGLTAAHKSLPFGTNVEVCSLLTGKSVVVRVNDRGPFVKGRDLDLSFAAAKLIGIDSHGVSKVRFSVVQ